MPHKSDAELIEKTHNAGRFFTEHRQVAWVLLVGVVLWGIYGYRKMPQRKDPDIPVRVAVALCPWPGVSTVDVEQLVTRAVERKIAENTNIHPGTAADFGIRSLTLPGLSVVYVQLAEDVDDAKKQFSDINLKLTALNDHLPEGAGPINFQGDFGSTTALMLTVASPRVDPVEIGLRAHAIRRAMERARAGTDPASRVSLVASLPRSVSPEIVRPAARLFIDLATAQGVFTDPRVFTGPGFLGVDAATTGNAGETDARILAFLRWFVSDRLHESEFYPDSWPIIAIRKPEEVEAKLSDVAGDKYSYKELDEFTDLIARTIVGAPEATKVDRAGVLGQAIYLSYSQERLASYGLQATQIGDALDARNRRLPGGMLEAVGRNLLIDPSGGFKSEREIGDVIVSTSYTGTPVYVRDLVDISRGYQSPPRYLNFYTWRDSAGAWHRSRAVTVAVQMRAGSQIAVFGEHVDEKLKSVMALLPPDLIVARTSDQPRQVEEAIELFMDALYEAIILVVIVSAIGFWDWRSALLMALSIPITLAMAFGMASVLGLDLQQVSIATLIIALGLLVDN